MKPIDYHGLRFQIFLVIKLFVICIGVAVYFVANRPWVEGFFKESYAAPPDSLQEVISRIRMGASIEEEYERIPIDDRTYLFDYWMQSEPVDQNAPRILLSTDFETFSFRAERTLVSGSPEQQIKALRFFELAKNMRAIPILEKALAWSQRRKLRELESKILNTIQNLQKQS